MKKVLFIKNALVLTVTSLILRFLGVIFRIWLSAEIGSEGMGLYQIIFSFYVFAATFTTSGINTAVTRLVSDETLFGSKQSIKKIMLRAFLITSLFALLSTLLVFWGSNFVAEYIISDARAVFSIRVLSLSLFFMGISSCIKGYFLARRKSVPPSLSQIIEQTVRIMSVLFLVKHFSGYGIQYACAAVFLGDVIAEFSSFLYLYLYYKHDTGYLSYLAGRKNPNYAVSKQLLRIATPITAGKYINSLLRTIESTLVPTQLVVFGITRSSALSFLGIIKGMALPILFFPSSLLNSLSTLLIPEISESIAKGNVKTVRYSISTIITTTSIFSFLFSGIFFFCGDDFGFLIYKSSEVGKYIKLLAPLVPFMYLDSIADGILKGLDQQLITFRNSVSDSAMRIILIFFLLPRYGENAFIWIMYLSNAYTCFLNVFRLVSTSKAEIPVFRSVFLPFVLAFSVTFCVYSFSSLLRLSAIASVLFVGFISIFLYFFFLFIFGCIKKEEMQRLT